MSDCPLPHEPERVVLAHGGGGRAMRRLLKERVASALGEQVLQHDAALLSASGKLALTTDSFVVNPLFFPGGDIGELAVYGTVNDLASAGAEPLALTLSLILEEGLELGTLDRVLASVRAAADQVGVQVVTGDTKVVERGHGHGLYLNTAGLGQVRLESSPQRVREGDVVLVSGDLGRHGVAVMAARQGLAFETPVRSDCASCLPQLRALDSVRCLRDPTRGGLAAVLHELAGPHDLLLDEAALPVHPGVRAACELLGLDPVHLPCEGRLVAFVDPEQAPVALAAWQALDPSAAQVGRVVGGRGRVWLQDAYGGERLLDLPLGEQLPRIC